MVPHNPSSLGGPLHLADEGSFFVGGRRIAVAAPFYGSTGMTGPGQITVGQMYVQYRVPVEASGPSVILVPGSNHTGACYETTPDGREGWATYFLRRGFPVYVVDHAGRGRSGFNPMALNDAIGAGDIGTLRPAPLFAHEGAWVNFRFGAQHPEPFAGSQFPAEAMDHYFAQLVPNAEEIAAGPTGEATIQALGLLLDRVGPAVLVVHSQSGPYGLATVRLRPRGVKALVAVEGGCPPIADTDVRDIHAKVPTLSVFGDYSVGARGANGDQRRDAWRDLAAAIRTHGGTADALLLPEHGHMGNSHMLMMDRNNLAIADTVIGWLAKNGVVAS
jgi:pimeloyl-ACP methyl ester carboxylesterase